MAAVAMIALTLFQASRTMQAGKKQAQEVVRQGELAGKEKAKQVRHKVARQTVSFLNSGLTLEGTPESVIGDTFSVGMEDISQIAQNTNAKSKATISSARTAAIGQIAKGFGMASMGGDLFGGGSPTDITSAGGVNGFSPAGFEIGGSAIDLSPTGFGTSGTLNTFGG